MFVVDKYQPTHKIKEKSYGKLVFCWYDGGQLFLNADVFDVTEVLLANQLVLLFSNEICLINLNDA